MQTRKELKKSARKNLKGHYPIFMLVCLIAAFLGTEFIGSLAITKIKTVPEIVEVDSKTINQTVHNTLKNNHNDKISKTNNIVKEQGEEKNKILGRRRGIFAMIANNISTGSIYITFIIGMNSIIDNPNIISIILIILSLLLSFLTWLFLGNMYQVISRRIFLEGRVYKRVPMQRFLFLLRTKKWCKTAWTMFVTSAFYSLWSLTIVGILIKRYSYILVPYIIAENPNIKTLDAINLSRRMMNGHKMECFKLEMSFLGWTVLGILTLGLTEIFYSNPYKISTLSEYYVYLRKIAKENKILGVEKLNDTYLYEKADKIVLEKEYSDIITAINKQRKNYIRPKGIIKQTAYFLGISLSDTIESDKIEQEQLKVQKLEIFKNSLQGREYPTRLFTIPERNQRPKIDTINYMRRYSIWSLIILFFIISIIGWFWEVILHIIVDGNFVKRGVLQGPWLPIYGFGGILILTLLNHFRPKPLWLFISSVILCGTIEYFTSFYLEIVFDGKKWWDYSGYFLNLNGRICAEGLLVFGLGGITIVYFIAPLLDNLIQKIKHQTLVVICLVLLSFFILDNIYSQNNPNTGSGITDYKSKKIITDIIKS